MATKTTKKPSQATLDRRRREAEKKRQKQNTIASIWLFVLAIIFCALAFFKGQPFWNTIRGAFFGVFGFCAYLIGPIMIIVALLLAYNKRATKLEAWSSALFFIAIAGAIYIFGKAADPNATGLNVLLDAYEKGAQAGGTAGSGVVGLILGWPLKHFVGHPAAEIIILLLATVFALMFTGKSLVDIIEAVRKPISKGMDAIGAGDDEEVDESENTGLMTLFGSRKKEENERQPAQARIDKTVTQSRNGKPLQEKAPIKRNPVIDIPLSDRPGKQIDIPLGPDPVIPPKGPAAEAAQEVFAKASPEDITRVSSLGQRDSVPEHNYREDPVNRFISDKMSDVPEQQTFSDFGKPEKSASKTEKAPSAKPETGYIFPPIDYLSQGRASRGNSKQDLSETGRKLVQTLDSFGVNTTLIGICEGPTVTRFELQPKSGVKVSRITGLADDIALNLAAPSVRIEAPIPNKAAVGIEVPNNVRQTVTLRSVIDSEEFKKSKSPITVALGKDISGQVMVTDISEMPHLLVAGTTGSGKSICLHCMIVSMLYKAPPSELKFIFIDPKMVEFGRYNGIPHMLIPVVNDVKKASGALQWAVGEMLKRYKLFASNGVRDIDAYNRMVDKKKADPASNLIEDDESNMPLEHLPRIVIVIDELADLMMAAKNEVEDAICRLAQMARAAGLHLIIATQRPSVDVITGLIKANIASRIALTTGSAVDSRTILDTAGAEKLLGRGDMLFSPVSLPKPVRIQGCFVKEDEEIHKVCEFLRRQKISQNNAEVEAAIEKLAAASEKQNVGGSDSYAGDGGEDPMVEQAAEVVIEAGQASTSMLQRKLRLGYSRAARIMDILEDRGIIGPQEGSKPREVRLTMAQWRELQMRRDDN